MKIKYLLTETHKRDSQLKKMVIADEITGYELLPNGEVDIKGELVIGGTFEDMGIPKVNDVDGNFNWTFVPSTYDPVPHWPRTVNGDCVLTCPEKSHIKSSQLPRNRAGTGLLSYDAIDGTIEIDDNTMSSYTEYRFGQTLAIIKGLEYLPRDFQCDYITINTPNLEGLPPIIKCGYLEINVKDAQSLKGIHRKMQLLHFSDHAVVRIPQNTGVLSLLQLLKNSNNKETLFLVIQGESPNSPLNQNLRRVTNKILADDEIDVFEMQERLIDAGLSGYAK